MAREDRTDINLSLLEKQVFIKIIYWLLIYEFTLRFHDLLFVSYNYISNCFIVISFICQVTALELNQPVPVDFYIAQKTKVLVITGPNTGGKTICLKTVGLAAMMAKSGTFILFLLSLCHLFMLI